jgi:glycosyltransferase involved in cell wall biosynthesis
MNIWVIRDLEPLPTDPDDRRLMRTAMLCDALVEAGHEVTWFTSSFDHYRKRHRTRTDQSLRTPSGLAIEVLACRGYGRNVGPARVLHNRQFARRFAERYRGATKRPELLLADIPTTEAAATVVRLGREAGIPTVVSVRDTWPDAFLSVLPPLVRPLALPMQLVFDCQARFALGHATAVIGVSPRFLDWARRKGNRPDKAGDRVVPLGYVPVTLDAAAREAAAERLALPQSGTVVAFVGSWGFSADLATVAAAARLLAGRPDIRFVIGGDTAGYETVAVSLRALPNVTLAGWLDSSDIAALLERADIGLLPYAAGATQGLPNKVYEYMAYGVHQVSTLGGEIAGLYAETGAGECIPPGDPAALAAVILARAARVRSAHERGDLRQLFADRFHARHIYGEMARHVTGVAATYHLARVAR